jgi:TatD DNase family protein
MKGWTFASSGILSSLLRGLFRLGALSDKIPFPPLRILMLCDAHNHLQDDWLAPHLDAIAAECGRLDIGAMVVNGTAESDWPVVAKLAQRFAFVRPSYGVHPWDVRGRSPLWLAALRARLIAEPGAAVGEIGIDRWILEPTPAGRAGRPGPPRERTARRSVPAVPEERAVENPAPLAEQIEVFLPQLALAVELDRPASIHCLQAWGQLDELLRSRPLPQRGVLLHAYGGPAEMVPGFVKLGAYFSFNGSFLAEKKTRQQTAFRAVPADRLLVETDAPALPPPVPWLRFPLPPSPEGKAVNHPANIAAIYEGLARLRGVKVEELARQVETNFAQIFG